jgi:hypothetical protein
MCETSNCCPLHSNRDIAGNLILNLEVGNISECMTEQNAGRNENEVIQLELHLFYNYTTFNLYDLQDFISAYSTATAQEAF